MPRFLQFNRHFQRIAEQGVSPQVSPVEQESDDDTPPAELMTERYSAWSATTATAVFGFVPFSAPPGR
jgi:hypothetical protein